MIQKVISRVLVVLFVFGISLNADAQRKKKTSKKDAKETVKPIPKPKPKKGDIKDYADVVTKDVKTDKGLFMVHKKDEAYLFEIPDSLLGRDMLMVTRIAKTANGLGFGGGKMNTQMLRWERKDKKILLRVISTNVVADENLPVHEAVKNSNFDPILFAFPIEAINKETNAIVIDATTFFTTDVAAIGLPSFRRSRLKVSRLDAKRSFIDRINSYPQNIEIRDVKTYIAGAPMSNASVGSVSIELSNSMILLPKVPMKRRYADERVGWFSRSQVDYGLSDQKSKTVRYLDRYRLEVKEGRCC